MASKISKAEEDQRAGSYKGKLLTCLVKKIKNKKQITTLKNMSNMYTTCKLEVDYTLVTWAEGAWKLNVNSQWPSRAQCYSSHMPTAPTLESRSYLCSGIAELNIKIYIHKSEHFTESKFYLSYSIASETEAQIIYSI